MVTDVDRELANAHLELMDSRESLTSARKMWGYDGFLVERHVDRYDRAITRYANAVRASVQGER